MAQARKVGLNYRCPRCFMRDIDIDLLYDTDMQEYRCQRCSYHGTEEDILRLYEVQKDKYGFMKMRVTDFGEDNASPEFKPHVAGEQ